MANNPITDAALAELDRLHAAATPGEWRPEVPAWNKHRRNCKTAIYSPTGTVLNTVTPKVPRDGVIGYRPPGECKIAQYIAALHNAYPALRQRILDAESRLAEVERERGVSSMPPEYVKNVIRASRGDRKKMREATARAEAAEKEAERLRGYNESLLQESDELIALVAVLRGALDISRVKFDWIRQNAEPPAIDGGIGSVWRAAISAHTEVVAALSLTPASAGNRIKAEAYREAARLVDSCSAETLHGEADRLIAEAEKEAANGR